MIYFLNVICGVWFVDVYYGFIYWLILSGLWDGEYGF